MNDKVLGQNLYGWVMLRLTSFLVIPTLAGVMVFCDLFLMLFTNKFLPIFSAVTLLYTFYRSFSGKQYVHSSVNESEGIYLRLDESEEGLIYKAFSIIAPNKYELQVYRTLGASKDATLSVDTRDKVATVYLREEVYQVLKASEEYSAIILPQIVKEAYTWFKYSSSASTVHLDGMMDSVLQVGETHASKMKGDNSVRTGMLIGAVTGGAKGAALGGAVGVGAKTTRGGPVVVLMVFAIAGILYFFAVSCIIWLFQFPYNQRIRRRLKKTIYQPLMNEKERKELRQLKRQADAYPRKISDNDADYSKELGWSVVI